MTTAAAAPADVDLAQIVAQADPAILLASIVSITGDTSRIASFAPYLTHEIAHSAIRASLDDTRRKELNAWAIDVIGNLDAYSSRDALPLDDDSFQTLASHLTGIPIERQSIPFLREQGGFTSFSPTIPRTKSAPQGFKVLIIGAGMAGITMAAAAKTAGFDFEVLEKGAGIGGVWLQNRYPGVGVDTHSKYYSLSFEVNASWTNSYPEGAEFREYLDAVAHKHDVFDKFTFNAEVTDMEWEEEAGQWRVFYLKEGTPHETTATAVVTAAGYLTRPALPDVPGIDTFKGASFHSAEWNEAYDFTDKRVAVVGTGCTSVQIVDALAPKLRSLSLFQRQPHWVVPPAVEPTIPEAERWLLMNVPSFSRWARLHTFIVIGDVNYDAVRYDAQWAAEHDLSISEANERGRLVAQEHLEASFPDRPDLREKLQPSFAFMGKRPIRDPGAYYSTLKKDTSEVITTGLASVRPEGPVDGDGNLHEVDAIVYATGFTLEYLTHLNIVGRDGRKLSEVFGDSPEAYLGCQIPGFPNLFMTSGPNANPSHGGGHNFCVEAVVHYVVECLQTLVENDARSIEPTEESLSAWIGEVRELLADSIWMRETRATTYYRNSKGEVLLANPLRMEDYWYRLREPDLADMKIS
ncbi:flavin-containing monooxygenase [Rhodococcus koreensis]